MRKNTVFTLLATFVAVVLLVVCVIQRLQINDLRSKEAMGNAGAETSRPASQERAEFEKTIGELRAQIESRSSVDLEQQREIEKVRAKHEETVSHLENTIRDLRRSNIALVPPGGDAAAEDDVSQDDEETTRSSPARSVMAKMADMMKDPEMREMVRSQQKMMLPMMYGSLFKELGLTDEELDGFKELLIEKQMRPMDIQLEMMSGSLTPDEIVEKTAQAKEMTAEADKQIEDFLGEEAYAKYKGYEETQAARMQVNLFKQSLAGADRLNERQESDLIRVMHEEMSVMKSAPPLQEDALSGSNPFMAEDFEMTHVMTEELNGLYLLRAEEILTPAQLQQFQNHLKQQQAMTETMMRTFGAPGEDVKKP